MRLDFRRMARRAMLFVYILTAAGWLGGCTRTVYESVAFEAESEKAVPDHTESADPGEQKARPAASEGSGMPRGITVYICGAVRKTGVYVLSDGSRVCDAVEAAGGLTPDADEKSLNQARILEDGEQITVLTAEETGGRMPEADVSGTGRVNINRAEAEELMTLRGIGSAKAGDIISYREEHGPFETIEDIMKVSGIKSSLFERIRDSITVG